MRPIRVLIVEDDNDILNLLQATLEPQFECMKAGNGLDAVQMALEGEPDLIVSDIMMPILDGHEMIRRLRKFPSLEQIPVIFLSALGSQDNIRKGYQLGAALYLTKPIDPARFRRNVELFVTDHAIRPGPKRRTAKELDALHNRLAAAGTGARARAAAQATTAHTAPASAQPAPAKLSRPKNDHKPTPLEEKRFPVIGRAAPPPTPPPADSKPAPPPAPRPMVAAKAAPAPPPMKVRILVVEEEEELRKEIRAALGGEYEILMAADGMEAIERAARYKPDVFVIDMKVSKMNGYQLVMMMRKNYLFQSAPIIFTSDKEDVDRERQYVEKIGAQYFLPKPYRVPDLAKQIEAAINEPFFEMQTDRIDFKQAMIELSMDEEISTPVSETQRVSQRLKAESGDWKD